MLSLSKAPKQPKLEKAKTNKPSTQVHHLVHQLANMSPAKQNAVNQAAHLAMNSGQFQPIYYYTANPNATNGVQLGYPGVYPFQFYNFAANPQFAHPQPGQAHPHAHPNHPGLLGAAPTAADHHNTTAKTPQKQPSKSKLLANNSNSTSEGSDNGVHSIHTKSVSSHSNSEHGDEHAVAEMVADEPPQDGVSQVAKPTTVTFKEVSEITQMMVAPKVKKPKPAKPVKKVIVIDLPENLHTIDTVTNALSQHGEILSVRVIKPGKIMPFDLKMYSGKIPDLGTTVCAIVEFDSPEGANTCVESETGSLRLALLKQGADATLYSNNGKRIISDSTSEHTHGESGIGENSNRLVSNRDSLSNHSHDELEPSSEFLPSPEEAQQPVFKQKALLPTPTDLEPLDLNLDQDLTLNNFETPSTMTEVDFNSNNSESQVVQPPAQTSQQSSKIISTSNGRITTALTITLTNGAPKPIPRSAIKLDLTARRHPKINMCASQLLPDPVQHVGRISPGLLSDPSDDLLVESRFSNENSSSLNDDHKKYSREHLVSLRESKRALQLPNGLPNIPELLPTSKQVVIVQTNSNAGPHKGGHHNQGHGGYHNKGHNQYKYNNNSHHNSHFSKNNYGKQ